MSIHPVHIDTAALMPSPQIFSTRQTLFKGQHYNEQFFDTLVDLTVNCMNLTICEAASRALESLDTLIKQDPVLAYLVRNDQWLGLGGRPGKTFGRNTTTREK